VQGGKGIGISRDVNFLRNLASLLPLVAGLSSNAAESKPNIVLILADDLGWADLGCYGSTFYQTPHIDRLAREGLRFADAYAAAPVCSPTRAAILTGKHPARLHLTDWLPGRQDMADQKLTRPKIRPELSLEENTLAEVLKAADYSTAHVGKWHLGGQGFGPEKQGFDLNIAGDQSGSPASYFAPFRNEQRSMPGLEQSDPGEYLTDRLTLEAEKFVEQNKDRPFFLYLAHYAVHIPLQAKGELIAKYRSSKPGERQTNALYAAMIQSLDESVGRIVKKLEVLGLSEKTVVLFTSDNGGLSVREGPNTPATSNAPLRAGKGYLHEGGLRVPLIVKWPGVVHGGSASRVPVISMDCFPTILAMAGIRLDHQVDGVDLVPLLKGGEIKREALYWHYPHYANQVRSPGAPTGGGPGAAIRSGDWKLIQHFENGAHELYNLRDDIGEETNLADKMPEQVLELGRRLHEWQNSVNAQWPTYNPEFKAPPIRQAAEEIILLHSRDAVIHGQQVRYEPQPHKNTVGYWTRVEDWVSWDVEITEPGTFLVDVLQGCGKGNGGSEVEVSMGEQILKFAVQDTGGFQNFIARDIGRLTIAEPGRFTLSVKPKTKPGAAVMDLRQVVLKPVMP
jgi:arylsulfatase A-like enzyme